MAAPLIITENNGLKRTIALQGRSLPYKGAVLVEDEQRVEITFFPGNPVAYAQILGPQLTRTVFNGTWKDKYLQLAENAPRVLNFPTVSAAGQPLQPGSNLITGATFTSAKWFKFINSDVISGSRRNIDKIFTAYPTKFGKFYQYRLKPLLPCMIGCRSQFKYTLPVSEKTT